jgi:ubiquitin
VTDAEPTPEQDDAPDYEADVEQYDHSQAEDAVARVEASAPVAYGTDGPDYSQDPFAPQQ